MRRVAQFLDIEIPETQWPELVEAAGFEAMKRVGDELIPMAKDIWGEDGASRFFSKARSRSWSELRQSDLELYDGKVRRCFEPELADWIENGRLGKA